MQHPIGAGSSAGYSTLAVDGEGIVWIIDNRWLVSIDPETGEHRIIVQLPNDFDSTNNGELLPEAGGTLLYAARRDTCRRGGHEQCAGAIGERDRAGLGAVGPVQDLADVQLVDPEERVAVRGREAFERAEDGRLPREVRHEHGAGFAAVAAPEPGAPARSRDG